MAGDKKRVLLRLVLDPGLSERAAHNLNNDMAEIEHTVAKIHDMQDIKKSPR